MSMRSLRTSLAPLLLMSLAAPALAQQGASQQNPAPEVLKIWPGAAPGTEDWKGPETENTLVLPGIGKLSMVSNVTVPTLTLVRPAKPNGTAVIVVPGGGFQALAMTHEGVQVANWLADRGITAFILKYRVHPTPGFRIPPDIRHHPELFDTFAASMEDGRKIALTDALQAVRFVRANAARFGIRPDHLGMIGFSAGSMTTMGVILDGDPATRPNFAAPIYGAMENKAPPPGAPPLFIAATQDDNAVPVSKSVQIFSAWTAAGLPAELHIFERGGHGFGMSKHGQPVDDWTRAFEAWLREGGWLPAQTPNP
ncbi:MAG TPA: alpha/beta hydrolase [Sphingobium sp.]|uniref:alpha/beta hydrolase n=1 Tax=Sphingobium sp. TaxID=1912891 RepID=UPI002ED25CE0